MVGGMWTWVPSWAHWNIFWVRKWGRRPCNGWSLREKRSRICGWGLRIRQGETSEQKAGQSTRRRCWFKWVREIGHVENCLSGWSTNPIDIIVPSELKGCYSGCVNRKPTNRCVETGIPQPVPSSNSPGKPQVVDKKHVSDSYELGSQVWSWSHELWRSVILGAWTFRPSN